MHLLPQGDELVEVFGGDTQNAPHRTTFRVRRPDSVGPVGQAYRSVVAQIDNHFGLFQKSVDVARRVVLRTCNVQRAAKSKRCHCFQINLSRLGLYTSISLNRHHETVSILPPEINPGDYLHRNGCIYIYLSMHAPTNASTRPVATL